jgi:hypothetical protein
MAETYKQLTKGTSVKPTAVLVEKLNSYVPFSTATGILDNGSGPGPIMSKILEDYGTIIPTSATLSCTDFAASMIEQVQESRAKVIAADPRSPWSRVQAEVLDALDLSTIQDASHSHVAAGWVCPTLLLLFAP